MPSDCGLDIDGAFKGERIDCSSHAQVENLFNRITDELFIDRSREEGIDVDARRGRDAYRIRQCDLTFLRKSRRYDILCNVSGEICPAPSTLLASLPLIAPPPLCAIPP